MPQTVASLIRRLTEEAERLPCGLRTPVRWEPNPAWWEDNEDGPRIYADDGECTTDGGSSVVVDFT